MECICVQEDFQNLEWNSERTLIILDDDSSITPAFVTDSALLLPLSFALAIPLHIVHITCTVIDLCIKL